MTNCANPEAAFSTSCIENVCGNGVRNVFYYHLQFRFSDNKFIGR